MAEDGRSLLDKLPGLRVIDLKRELEKRKLSKSGSKRELVDKLRIHLKQEESKQKSTEQSSDASISSLSLPSDAAVETNEFVKNYLEQREILLERQMKQKMKYQEEASKSQGSESQSEAEDLSQHHQQDSTKSLEETSVKSEEISQKNKESVSSPVKEVKTSTKTHHDKPEYNSETDEDTEDEAANYVVEPTQPTKVDKENLSKQSDSNDDDTCSAQCDEKAEDLSMESKSSEVEVKAEDIPSSTKISNANVEDSTTVDQDSEEDDKPKNEPSKDSVEVKIEAVDLSGADVMHGSDGAESNSQNDTKAEESDLKCHEIEETENQEDAKVVSEERGAISTEVEMEAGKKDMSELDKDASEKYVPEKDDDVPEESKDASEESKDTSEESNDASEENKDVSEENKDVSEENKDVSKENKDVSEEEKDVSEEEKDESDEEKVRSEKDTSEEEKVAAEEVPDSPRAEELSETETQSEVKQHENEADNVQEASSLRPSEINEELLDLMVQKEDEFDEIKTSDDIAVDKSSSIKSTSCVAKTKDNVTSEQEDHSKKANDNVKTLPRKLLRNNQKEGEVAPQDKPARKRKWGSVELETQSVAISSDSLKGLIPEVMIDLSVPCDVMMDVIGADDPQPESKSRMFRRQTTEQSDQQVDDGKRRKAVTSSSAAGTSTTSTNSVKLGRTIYQKVSDGGAEIDGSSVVTAKEGEKHRERRVVERKVSVEEMPERSVIVNRKDSDADALHADDSENANKKRRINPSLQLVDEPVVVERGRRDMTPPRNPVSKFIHIFNLVRPYTLNQLKEILQRTGTLLESGFWIDKIKSHCIAEYETLEQAVESRKALHGKKWPACNPKILRVDFSDETELDTMRNAKDGAPLPQRQRLARTLQTGLELAAASAIAVVTAEAVDDVKAIEAPAKADTRNIARDARRSQERHKERDLGGRREEVDKRRGDVRHVDERRPRPLVREWDRNKVRISEERETERHGINKRHHTVSHHDKGDSEVKRQRRRSDMENDVPSQNTLKEEPPAKLLDDLFRKTKATPCIYWLPLTEDQIAEKEKQLQKLEAERLQRRAERDKKIEEERDERMRTRVVAQRGREGDRRWDF